MAGQRDQNRAAAPANRICIYKNIHIHAVLVWGGAPRGYPYHHLIYTNTFISYFRCIEGQAHITEIGRKFLVYKYVIHIYTYISVDISIYLYTYSCIQIYVYIHTSLYRTKSMFKKGPQDRNLSKCTVCYIHIRIFIYI